MLAEESAVQRSLGSARYDSFAALRGALPLPTVAGCGDAFGLQDFSGKPNF